MWLLTATPAAPEPTSRIAEAAFTSILPTAEKPEEGEPVLETVDTGLTARDKEMEVTTRPRETTQFPITQRVSTVRATTAQAVTSHPHRDVQPGRHETSVPTAPGQPDHHPPSATEGGTSVIKEVVEDGATNQLPTGEGSGEQVRGFVFPGWPLVPGIWHLSSSCPLPFKAYCSLHHSDGVTGSHLPLALNKLIARSAGGSLDITQELATQRYTRVTFLS